MNWWKTLIIALITYLIKRYLTAPQAELLAKIAALEGKADEITNQIAAEMDAGSPDIQRVARLHSERLWLNREIARLRQQLNAS